MTRIFQECTLHPSQILGELALGESQSHHLSVVLRMGVGEAVTVFNGLGGEYQGTISAIKKKRVWVSLAKFLPIERESPLKVILAQSICRGEKMDFVVQKAVELGVTGIVPVLSEKQAFKLKPDAQTKKIAHWQAVAVSACEQSGRNTVPKVYPALALSQLKASHTVDHYLCLSPEAKTTLAHCNFAASASILAIIGPEAGFSEAEISYLLKNNFVALNLGHRILRTETAGMALLAILQHNFGDI